MTANFNTDARGQFTDVIENASRAFRRQLMAWATSAKDKEVADLTDDERFAIAVLAGVRFNCVQTEDGSTRFMTEACGIYKVDGQFRVVTAREEWAKRRGTVITIPIP